MSRRTKSKQRFHSPAPHGHNNGHSDSEKPFTPTKILTIDIGGSKVKALVSGHHEPRRVSSGKDLTPTKMVESIKALTDDWEYEGISIGYPGLVGANGPRSEPGNLARGWVGFDFAAAFGMPVRILNDAA